MYLLRWPGAIPAGTLPSFPFSSTQDTSLLIGATPDQGEASSLDLLAYNASHPQTHPEMGFTNLLGTSQSVQVDVSQLMVTISWKILRSSEAK